MENITLTIDEIHAIREEHSEKTKGMDFNEYRAILDAEIAPTLLALAHAKQLISVPQDPPLPDEIEAILEGRKDRAENGTASHEDIDWD